MIASGTAVGVSIYAIVGGMGLVGGFGGIGIGMAPVAAAGGIIGAACFGSFQAIREKDGVTFSAVGIGAVAGIGVYSAVGGMGLSLGGTAVGIGMGTMASAGGIVGLAAYGLYKIINQADTGKNLDRNLQVLAEITNEYEDKKRWLDLEIDAELEALKAQMQIRSNPN
ncbi:hypothetical protein [Aerosakkonema funiforme]|uniref:Uncharacterized protein n=1 Tax=Aerosakkonema funiforme FACHB-1375 TaxID=2949571 RepID=A0A926VJL1_9CYAN|nr:hypothetical protein [Aerosakkonema funiforme]MBD2184413.1 hypothetical protein [Aerosakkonema funiforme FACHB-1375]